MPVYAAAAPGELLVQELTGLPVIWKPLREDGRSQFDDHPRGEGYSLREWLADKQSGKYTDHQMRWKRAGCFLRVRCTYAEMQEFFRDDTGEGFKDPITGEDIVQRFSVTVKRLSPEALTAVRLAPGSPLEVAGQRCPNVLAAALLAAPDVVKTVTPDDALRLSLELDTRANAILTVGTGKTYSTISTAITASSSGDIIEVYATTANTYSEGISLGTKILYVRAMVAAHALIINNTAGVGVTFPATQFAGIVEGFTIKASSNNNGVTVVSSAAPNCFVVNCKIYQGGTAGTGVGISTNQATTVSGGHPASNCIIWNFATGLHTATTSRFTAPYHCTVVDCTTGITTVTVGAAVPNACLVAGGTTNYANCSAVSAWNVSADATAPGVAAATGFVTTDFVDYAGDDFRLKAAVIGTTLAKVIEIGRASCRERV